MKTFKTLPTNEEFFKKYAILVPTLNILGYLAQIVSALTEIGVIYLIIYTSLRDFFPAIATFGATIGSGIGTAFIELGLRKFLPFSIRAILFKRFQGLDRIMTIFVILACILLLAASGYLSFKGSKAIVEAAAPEPVIITTLMADSTATDKKKDAYTLYKGDSIEIVSRYTNQLQALETSAKSAIAAGKIELRNVEAKERLTGQAFGTQKRNIRQQIADIQSEKDARVAKLEIEKAKELAGISKERKSLVQKIEADHNAQKDSIQLYNNGAVEKVSKQVKNYGGGLAWFTVVCLIVFILSVVLNEVHQKGSGIEEIPQPNQYLFEEGVFAALRNAVSDRLNYIFHSRIRRWADQTPAPLEPAPPPTLYDVVSTPQPRRKIGTPKQAVAQSMATTKNLFQIPPGYLRKPEIQNKATPLVADQGTEAYEQRIFSLIQQTKNATPEACEAIELSAKDIISLYLNKPAESLEVQHFYNACKAHVEGIGENPFAHHRTIVQGFTKQEATGKNRTCEHCNQPYIYRHHKQKFCTEACRIAAFEARKGRKLFKSDFKKQQA